MRLEGVCIAGVVLGGAPAVGAGPPPIEPFTQEAVARGLAYILPSNPPGGYLGFGCGFADLDGDGDADVVILGAADGHVGIFENDGTGFFIDRSATSGIPNLPEASALAASSLPGCRFSWLGAETEDRG